GAHPGNRRPACQKFHRFSCKVLKGFCGGTSRPATSLPEISPFFLQSAERFLWGHIQVTGDQPARHFAVFLARCRMVSAGAVQPYNKWGNHPGTPNVKVALAQINPTIGDIEANVAKILDFARRAREGGAELVIFPELAVCGYPPMDLLLKDS